MRHKGRINIIIILLGVILSGCSSFIDINNSINISSLEGCESDSIGGTVPAYEDSEVIKNDKKVLLAEEFEVIEREAAFDEYEIPSRIIAEEYFNTHSITGVDTALVCFDGEYIYAVLSCYQNEMSQFPDLGELLIKYSIERSDFHGLLQGKPFGS